MGKNQLHKMMKKEACDCSPELCSVNDTSYHVHYGEICIHPDGSKHKIYDSIQDQI
jgi:hypothetical protein